MFTIQTGKLVGVAFAAWLGAGCSHEQQDWRAAESADTIEGYGQFIQHHPGSELVTEARSRVIQLAEERDWHQAGTVDTADAYRQFLAEHPNGKWAQEARIRIESFALDGQMTSTSASSPAAPAALVPAPRAPAAAPRRAAPSASGTASAMASASVPAARTASTPSLSRGNALAGVQLGAFNTEAGARKEWQALESRFAAQLQGLGPHIVTADTPSGRLYRLQAIVSDEQRARALCEALGKRGQACMTVQLR